MPEFDSGGIARSINRVQFGILSPDEVKLVNACNF